MALDGGNPESRRALASRAVREMTGGTATSAPQLQDRGAIGRCGGGSGVLAIMMALAFGALHLAARERHRLEDLLALIGGLHVGLASAPRNRMV